MKIRKRVALLLAAIAFVVVAGCTQPSGPGASNQPAASGGKPGY